MSASAVRAVDVRKSYGKGSTAVTALAGVTMEVDTGLGLLRAVGRQRRQLRRMVRVESVMISVYGALLGLAVGTAFGWALVRALRAEGITEFSRPVDRLALIVVVAALAGVLAAALPPVGRLGWMCSRLSRRPEHTVPR